MVCTSGPYDCTVSGALCGQNCWEALLHSHCIGKETEVWRGQLSCRVEGHGCWGMRGKGFPSQLCELQHGLTHRSLSFPHFLGNGEGNTQPKRLLQAVPDNYHSCPRSCRSWGPLCPFFPHFCIFLHSTPTDLFTCLLSDYPLPAEIKPDLACLLLT